jgi:uncharacterized protein (DUF488 family)
MRLFTIGFTKKSAEAFFTAIQQSGASKLVDVRLNNVSQLSGFTKKNDLRYFARALCQVTYVHLPEFAPTKEMLDEYKKSGGSWALYEYKFIELMTVRHVEQTNRDLLDGACLLCSEAKPEHCHRRLVAEYLRSHWGDLEIVHL